MKIEKDHVVRLHYTVSEAGGESIETSRDREPLAVLIGHQAIIPGLEEALLGRETGDTFEVTVTPDKAYGDRMPGLTQRVPKKHFKNQPLAVGMQVVVPTSMGPRPVTVQKIGLSIVDVDLNHPMAGKTLNFRITLRSVETPAATPKST
jgi:FKBP-type peptidyl-prolyl cis-trans isomerase SlyD